MVKLKNRDIFVDNHHAAVVVKNGKGGKQRGAWSDTILVITLIVNGRCDWT